MQKRRDTLLSIGELFTSEETLKLAVGKDTKLDMAIYGYAVMSNKLEMLSHVCDIQELREDVLHTEEHFALLAKRKKIKEDLA